MEDNKNVIQSSVMGEVWASEIEKIKQTSNIDIDVYDIGCDDDKKRVYCVKRSGDDGSKTSDTEKDNNSKNYQVKIVIDIDSGKLEDVDFGEQIEEPITIEKITEIQKSINICKKKEGEITVSYGRIAPIKDISAILSLVKEYCYHKSVLTTEAYYNPYKMGFAKNELDEYIKTDIIEKFNKSGIRFLCFTEDENSTPESKRNRLIKIMQKALDDKSIEVVSVMYSLQSTDGVNRHSIVVMMGCEENDCNNNPGVKIFDSNGSDYKNNRSYSDFNSCTDITLLNTKDEHVQDGKNCSYWSEGDLIVVFRKYLQEKGIKKELLTNQKKWNTEVLVEIICVVGYNNTEIFKSNYKAITGVDDEKTNEIVKRNSKTCLMRTIVGEQVKIQSTKTQGINHKKEDLKENKLKQAHSPNISLPQQNILSNIPTSPPPPAPPLPQNMLIPKPPQSTSSGGEEAASVEEAPEEQVKKQMQNVFSELLGKMEASDVSLTTPSSQPIQPDISQIPSEQSTMPRST